MQRRTTVAESLQEAVMLLYSTTACPEGVISRRALIPFDSSGDLYAMVFTSALILVLSPFFHDVVCAQNVTDVLKYVDPLIGSANGGRSS